MLRVLMVFLIALPGVSTHAYNSDLGVCKIALSGEAISPEQLFIEFISLSLRKGQISAEELPNLIKSIEDKKAVDWSKAGRLDSETSHLNLVSNEILRSPNTQVDQLLKGLRKLSDTYRNESELRHEVSDNVLESNLKMEFAFIPGGQFTLGGDYPNTVISLDHDFEIMTTELTELMWYQIFGQLPQHLNDANDQVPVTVAGQTVMMRPNRPVTKVSFHSMLVAANKLSEMHGFQPAYVFNNESPNQIGNAAAGTLILLNPNNVRVNSDKGLYSTEGYRLPSIAEWEYFATKLGEMSVEDFYVGREMTGIFDWAGVPDDGFPQHDADDSIAIKVSETNIHGVRNQTLEMTSNTIDNPQFFSDFRYNEPHGNMDRTSIAVGGSFSDHGMNFPGNVVRVDYRIDDVNQLVSMRFVRTQKNK